MSDDPIFAAPRRTPVVMLDSVCVGRYASYEQARQEANKLTKAHKGMVILNADKERICAISEQDGLCGTCKTMQCYWVTRNGRTQCLNCDMQEQYPEGKEQENGA